MKRLLFIGLFLPLLAHAGNENWPVGARSAGLGHASVTLGDLWSIHHNQAGLAYLKIISGGLFYENRFLIKELGLKGGAFALPTKSGTFGLSFQQFGYTNYAETKAGLAYGRMLSEKLAVGLQLDYLNIRQAENYGNKSMFAAEIGLLAQLTDELTFGAHVYNLNRAKITDVQDERVPTIMRIGANYQFNEKVLLAIETEKNIEEAPIIRGGVEYHITEPLYLRLGASSNPFLYSFGFGIAMKKFHLDIAASQHQVLGFTPQVSLSYDIK